MEPTHAFATYHPAFACLLTLAEMDWTQAGEQAPCHLICFCTPGACTHTCLPCLSRGKPAPCLGGTNPLQEEGPTHLLPLFPPALPHHLTHLFQTFLCACALLAGGRHSLLLVFLLRLTTLVRPPSVETWAFYLPALLCLVYALNFGMTPS